MPEGPLDPTHSPPQLNGARTLADGRYTLVRKVAEGGTAVVHLGWDSWTEQWRAVKTLLPEYAKRPALRHRFEREAATMKSLSHPNIIAVYDAGADDQTAWMVMEFAEGGSVIDWVERHGPMPPRMATQVVIELCQGIQAAHEEGIIHRDVKPQNLLVDRQGVCKVTDFGIAQVVQETRMTMTGTVMGTIGYMAPEQHESAKHADERSDVYSIAATYYTLLRGEAATHLFMADEDEYAGMPVDIAEALRKGSQYRRDARFSSVSEMCKTLTVILDGLPPDPASAPPLIGPETLNLAEALPPSMGSQESSPHETAGDETPVSDASSLARYESLSPGPALRDDPSQSHSDPTPSSLVNRRPQLGSEPTASRRIRPYSGRDRDERKRRNMVLRVSAILTGASFGIVFLILLAVTLVAGAQIQRLEAQEDRERREMYEAFHNHLPVLLPVLEPLELKGFDDAREIFREVQTEADPVSRKAAARRLHNLLLNDLQRQLGERDSPSEMGPRRQLEAAIKALGTEIEQHDRAQRLVDEERATVGGRIMTSVGG